MPKKPRRGWRYRGQRFTEAKFLPYATAIGQVALAWNDLHEGLAILFCTLCGGGGIGKWLAIWHSAKFDRPKRDMIRGAILHWTEAQQDGFPKGQKDIRWLLDRVDELEDARNNAVHSPLLLVPPGGIAGPIPFVITHTLSHHPRALRMALKNLLFEFRWCRAATLVLRDFTHRLDRALSTAGAPWPDKPKLPNRGQRNDRRDRRRGSKRPFPPSRSSAP